MARTPRIAPGKVDVMATAAESTWQGATVKSLETIEEASSVGVALSRSGVLILAVPPDSAAYKAGLREGDLLIRAAGRDIHTTGDLSKLQPDGIKVVRGQVELEMR
jgi:S1-C subfamily serine protease